MRGDKNMGNSIQRIDSNKNVGYSYRRQGQMSNGQVGIDHVEQILVVSCGNCGDYAHVQLKDIDEARKETKRVIPTTIHPIRLA